MPAIERRPRRVRASATAMRYWGLRILPSRVSLIFTAMVKRSLLCVSRCNSATRAGCPDPVLPRVYDHRASTPIRGGSRGGQPPIVPEGGRPAEIRSLHLLVDLRFDPAGHPPALGRPRELVVVPQPAEQDLLLVPRQHHRVEANHPRRRRIAVDAHGEVPEHV